MRTFVLFILSYVISANVTAQEVADWNVSATRIGEKVFELHLTVDLEDPWHIYSQNTPKGGPAATIINFSKNPLIILDGKVKEKGDMDVYHDKVFDVDVYSYSDKVDFVQVIKLKADVITNISGIIEFMTCTKEQCLPPKRIPFNVVLK